MYPLTARGCGTQHLVNIRSLDGAQVQTAHHVTGQFGGMYSRPTRTMQNASRSVRTTSSSSSGYYSQEGLYSTTGHFYDPRRCLGQGATSYVYLGLHQVTGEQRALKIPKGPNSQRDAAREIGALVTLDHRNIVKFYGVEEDFQSGKSVLVMEYCNGGSLYSMLQEPEYRHGLPDSEILDLLRDISAMYPLTARGCGTQHLVNIRSSDGAQVQTAHHVTGQFGGKYSRPTRTMQNASRSVRTTSSSSSGYYSQEGLCSTTGHFYDPRRCLGQGATSYVYLGLHQVTGEQRALKIPKGPNSQRDAAREIGALVTLDHRNVVKFYGVEEDFQSGKSVLVMEYCNGGSLYSMLQEPEYRRGLPDSEILDLLRDICCGLRTLLVHNILHRDIKPGNILRHVCTTGRSVYKLSDFGSSLQREGRTDEGEEIMSLAGTEEYLVKYARDNMGLKNLNDNIESVHPMIYKCAFVTREDRVRTNSLLELWSVGATLYHAASGSIPFKIYGGGRNNRNAMFQMISNKPPRKISGVQETKNGRFLWSEHLPATCNMSEGLKNELEPILVGLLESDPSRKWTYDTLFDAVDKVQSCLVVHVAYLTGCEMYTLYLSKYSSYSYFRERMAAITDQPSSRHLYYHGIKGLHIKDNKVTSLPPTSEDNPIILCLNEDNSETLDENLNFDLGKSFHSKVDYEKDFKSSLDLISEFHYVVNRIRRMQQCLVVMEQFQRNHQVHVREKAEHIRLLAEHEVTLIEQELSSFNVFREPLLATCSHIHRVKTLKEMSVKVQCTTKNIHDVVKSLRRQIFNCPVNSNYNNLTMESLSSDRLSQCEAVLSQAKDVWNNMKARRKPSPNSSLEYLQHCNDRSHLEALTSTLQQLWQTQLDDMRIYSETFGTFIKWSVCLTKGREDVHARVEEAEKLRRQFHDDLITLSVYSQKELDDKYLSQDFYSCSSIVRDFKDTTSDLIKTSKNYTKLLREKSDEVGQLLQDLSIVDCLEG